MKVERRKGGRLTIFPMLNQGAGTEKEDVGGEGKLRRSIEAEGGRDTEIT